MVAQPEYFQRLSPDEYLEHERAAAFRSEYLDGEIFAMAGASKEHVRIVFAISTSLGTQLRGQKCEGFSTDLRVRVGQERDYAYPDVIVACEPQFEDEQFDTLLNPRVVIEVLSPSTEDFDAGKKFARYQKLASLADYILVSQDEPRIQHFARQSTAPSDSWLLTIHQGLQAECEIASIDCVLRLAEIYERVF